MSYRGQMVECKGGCNRSDVFVGIGGTQPARTITGDKKSRGYYCRTCAERLLIRPGGRLHEQCLAKARELAQRLPL